MNIRYRNGLENLKEIDGKGGEDVIESLRDIAPDLGDYIIEFAFGDIYNRGVLSFRDRELLTLASLVTQGDTRPQLVVHINGALNVGLTKDEIIESFIHLVPYVGFPKVLNAISIAKEVFEGLKSNKNLLE